MKTLTAHTQVTLTNENGATKIISFKDFLLALPTHHANIITIDYVAYLYDSFEMIIEDETVAKPKNKTVAKPKKTVEKTVIETDKEKIPPTEPLVKTVVETDKDKIAPTEPIIPKESQPPTE